VVESGLFCIQSVYFVGLLEIGVASRLFAIRYFFIRNVAGLVPGRNARHCQLYVPTPAAAPHTLRILNRPHKNEIVRLMCLNDSNKH
jgi:hypothetical protein